MARFLDCVTVMLHPTVECPLPIQDRPVAVCQYNLLFLHNYSLHNLNILVFVCFYSSGQYLSIMSNSCCQFIGFNVLGERPSHSLTVYLVSLFIKSFASNGCNFLASFSHGCFS